MRCLPVTLVLLSVVVTAAAAADGDPQVYCQVDKNQYYVRQWGQCKDCDRCPRGRGLNKNRNVDLDPVHGALGCRNCIKCTLGETFKPSIGYEECQKCTNCTAKGKQVVTACTLTSDTECGEILPKENFLTKTQQKGPGYVPDPAAVINGKQQDEEPTGVNSELAIFGIVAIVLCIPSMVFTVVIVVKKKEQIMNCWRKDRSRSPSIDGDEEQGSLKDREIEHPPDTLETNYDEVAQESIPLNNLDQLNGPSTPYERQTSKDSEEMPPLASSFSYVLRSNPHLPDHDLEPDVGRFSDIRSNEVPNDKELNGMCRHIAHDNLYARLGRELGVNDNDIKRIRAENPNDLLETSFQTLKRWREMNGDGATKGVLRRALRNVGVRDIELRDDP